jgi:hypothetical protein
MLGLLRAAHAGGAPMSLATKGAEREIFIKHALSNVIAPPFRVGSGDITDAANLRSGQMDTVIEFENSISFPMTEGAPRLYLAEGVCAVIGVKSDLTKQRAEVLQSHTALMPLRRELNPTAVVGTRPDRSIPHFAVGFIGWKTMEAVERHRAKAGLSGVLTLDSELYADAHGAWGKGPWALLQFFAKISYLTKQMLGNQPDYTIYAK